MCVPQDKDNNNADNKEKEKETTIHVHQYDENQTHCKSKCTLIKLIEKCDIQVVIKIFCCHNDNNSQCWASYSKNVVYTHY